MSSSKDSISERSVVRICSSPLASQAFPGVVAKSRSWAVWSCISSVSSSRRTRRGSVGCLGMSLVYLSAQLGPERIKQQALHGGHTRLFDYYSIRGIVGGH